MSLIQVKDLSFQYEGSPDMVFEHASFAFDTDWKLGFIGRNGRGKTTFLKLLMGELAYRGTISGNRAFDYFPVSPPHPDYLVEEVARELYPPLEPWKFKKELSLLGMGEELLYRIFSTLSQGEQTKVLLAVLFLKEGRFLLIDEPTNHLDVRGRALVCQYLNRKKGFLLVSHDRDFLDRCVDHVLSINKKNMEVQKGNFSSWWENTRKREAFERGEQEKLQREIRDLSQAVRRTAGWSDQVEKSKRGSRISGLRPDRGYLGHKSAKMMKRAKGIEQRRERAVEEKSTLLQNAESREELTLRPLNNKKGTLFQARNLSLFYGSVPAVKSVTFSLEAGERLAIHGHNGAGKSTLLHFLAGETLETAGSFVRTGGLILSTVSQEASRLSGPLLEYAGEQGLDETRFCTILRKLDFGREQFEKRLEDYSAGQKKKVLLAKSLCRSAHVYLWDEPLNFIDVLSRMQMEELILRFQPTMVFVEHDQRFTQTIATRILSL